MKVIVQGSNQDFIVEYYHTAKIKNGEIEWVNQEDSIALIKNDIRNVTLFANIGDGNYTKVQFSKGELISLLDKIKEVESESLEPEFIDF